MTLYAKRDTMAQGDHYTRHVSAMTAEGLHAKSDIAAELAHRDMEIDRLRAALSSMTEDRDSWERQAADREQDALDLVAAERERFRAPLTAFAADLRACIPILSECGMAETAAEFANGAAELEALVGPNA